MLVSVTPDQAGRGAQPSGRAELQHSRLEKLNAVLRRVWERNPFYSRKWRSAGLRPGELTSLTAFADYPFTTRAELLADQTSRPPLGTNLGCELSEITRMHRSSGTTRAPLYWGDTSQTWDWVLGGSQALFELAGVTATDRLLLVLPFGCSSGPWIIYQGARRLGCDCFIADPADTGGQSRCLGLRPRVLVGRPSTLQPLLQLGGPCPYIRKIILTGGSFESPVGIDSFVRYGLTEAGSVAGECACHSGMHLLENCFIAEVVDPTSMNPIPDGACGELVLTTLGRLAQPIIRYRTGDLVRLVRDHHCACGRSEACLIGGVERLVA